MRLFSEMELDSDLSRYSLTQKQKDSVRRLIYIICDQYSKEIEKRDNQIEKMKHCMTCKHNLDSKYYCSCDLGSDEQGKCCYKNNRDKWELSD